MPVMDGYEFRRRMLEDDGLLGIPVIVLTAGIPSSSAIEALRAYAYLSKMTPVPELLAIVARVTASCRSAT